MNKTELNNAIGELRKRVEYWRTLESDPHNISTAVYVALGEVLDILEGAANSTSDE